MTSHKFWDFQIPLPLCHAKMAVLLWPPYIATQKWKNLPLLAWRRLWMIPNWRNIVDFDLTVLRQIKYIKMFT